MFLAFVLLVLLFVKLRNPKDRTAAFFECIVVWNLWSFALTEVLSCMKLLTARAVAAGWGIFDIVLIGFIIGAWHHGRRISGLVTEVRQTVSNNKLLWITGMIVLGLAVLTVPYNWDSMTYHLPRMMHWVQNRSAAHYAANDVRQLAAPVLAEFVNVQVYLLSGKRDILLNLLQAVSYLVNSWIIYRIADKIGADRKYAYLSALLFMTMPIAFAEALTTQVDLFASLWLLIFVYYFIDLFEADKLAADRDTLQKCLMMAICVALGYLAKPSVDVGMAVLLFCLLIRCMRRHDALQVLMKLAVCALPVVLLPLIPEWIRNYHTFSSLGDSSVGSGQLVGTLAPNYVLINFIKNCVQNCPSKYLYDSDEWMTKIVMIIARVLRADINAPSISAGGYMYKLSEPPVYNHDSASSPVVMILAVLCFILYLLRRGKKRSAGNSYTLYSVLLFVVFCVIVRWSPFITRFMVTYLAMLCPMIGYQLQQLSDEDKMKRFRNAAVPIIYFLCLTELFSLTRFHQEMWHEEASERPEGYFAHNTGIRPEYGEVFSWINEKGYDTLGIKVGELSFEYPIWAMTESSNVRIENILVQNKSAAYEDMSFIPECVIVDKGYENDETLTVHGQLYNKEKTFTDNTRINIYVKG